MLNITTQYGKIDMNSNKHKGFTLMEMLIVVAIIAVLVAIAIPIISGALHKSRVSADKANVRSYYAELQYNYLETGEYLSNKIVPYWGENSYDYVTIKLPVSNSTVKLQAGKYAVQKSSKGGYSVAYYCDYYSSKKGHEDHLLLLE